MPDSAGRALNDRLQVRGTQHAPATQMQTSKRFPACDLTDKRSGRSAQTGSLQSQLEYGPDRIRLRHECDVVAPRAARPPGILLDPEVRPALPIAAHDPEVCMRIPLPTNRSNCRMDHSRRHLAPGRSPSVAHMRTLQTSPLDDDWTTVRAPFAVESIAISGKRCPGGIAVMHVVAHYLPLNQVSTRKTIQHK
jgi:hypothetical protein